MANEPREFPDAIEGGQERYLIIDTLGDRREGLRGLADGEVGFIDLVLRRQDSSEKLYARVFIKMEPRQSQRHQDTWNFGDGDFQEIDFDGQPIGKRYGCNATITTLNVPFLGEVRVSTPRE